MVRAVTVRVWRQDGRVLRQGTWLTALLWLVSIGSHLAIGAVQHGSAAAAAGAATLAFLGVTLGAQQLMLRARAGALRRPDPRPRCRVPGRLVINYGKSYSAVGPKGSVPAQQR